MIGIIRNYNFVKSTMNYSADMADISLKYSLHYLFTSSQ